MIVEKTMAARMDGTLDQLDVLMCQALKGQLTRRQALKRALALGLGIPLVALVLAACGTAATPTQSSGGAAVAGTPKKGGTIKAGLDSDIANLDPLRSSLLVDRQVLYNIYDSLVTYDDKLTIQPGLAEKWELPDPKTYIFHLRQGVKFHDGTDFNAEAVKFNIERNLTDKNTKRKSELDTITSVEVVDPYTVKFNLKAPFAPLLANLVDRAGMMVSPKAAQAGGEDFTRKPIDAGTGPFKFVEWVTSDHITLTRNENYWRKDAAGVALPYLDKITYRPITDETVALTNLKTDDLDIGFIVPAKDYAGIKSGGELILSEMPGLGFASFELNTQSEPFSKKELRQAVAEAVDRDQLLKTVFFGIGQPAYGPVPPPSWAFDAAFKPYGASADKAKEYLKAGGKADGFTFEMKVSAGSPTTTQLAQLVKDQLAKANITMNITQLEFTKIVDDQQKGNFQATLVGWSGRIDPDGNSYNQFHTGGSLNDPKYSSKAVDDLLDQARSEGDQGKRKALYQQLQQQIVEDAPFVFYRFNPAFMLARPNVQGMQLYPDQIMRFATGSLK
jgi:peptide/nickel transport system substrate-binding protein